MGADRGAHVIVASDTRTELRSLAVVRLVPAFIIFTAHVTQFRLFADDSVQAFSSEVLNKAGYESVSFFIVLSGFILTWVVRPTGPDRVFLTKRFMKIYPTHVVTWVVCLATFGGGTVTANALKKGLVTKAPKRTWKKETAKA